MLASPVDSFQLLDAARPYAVLQADSWRWCSLTWGRDFKLSEDELPLQTDTEFVLLRERGDGKLLACTLSGRCCVIKFPHPRDLEEYLLQECSAWKTAHSEFNQLDQVRVLQLAKRHCLLLPCDNDSGG